MLSHFFPGGGSLFGVQYLPGDGGKCKFPMKSNGTERSFNEGRLKFCHWAIGSIPVWLSLVATLLVFSGYQSLAAQYTAGETATPNPAILNQTVVFTIGVTNTSFSDFTGMLITNTLPDSTGLQSASTTVGTINTSIPGTVILNVGALASGNTATLTINFLATGLATLTNVLSITATASTNLAEIDTLVTTNLTAVTTGTADLGAQLAGSVTNLLMGDLVTYTAGITNAGPNEALEPTATLNIPSELSFVGISPTNLVYSFTNQLLTVLFASLNAGSATNFQLTLSASASGQFDLSNSVSAPGNVDPNLNNNMADLSVAVGGPSTNLLQVVSASTQRFDPQTGTMEQTVQVLNPGPNSITGIRLVLNGLTNLFLDSVGTNQGAPFAYFGGTLNPGSTVDILLHFFVPQRQPLTNLLFSAVAQPGNVPALPTSGSLVPGQSAWLSSGAFLLEFGSTVGQSYTVAYADNPSFTNAVVSQPSVTALGSRTQWIDSGPPRTTSAPSNRAVRFYKVFQNP